jgi:hypothetical protein
LTAKSGLEKACGFVASSLALKFDVEHGLIFHRDVSFACATKPHVLHIYTSAEFGTIF